MAAMAQFTIGADASCTDGECGQVQRVVVDPVAEAVTHLVVAPKHREEQGRLVPLDLVDATAGEIRLACTLEQFENLAPAEKVQFIDGTGDFAGYTASQVGYWPLYGLGIGPGAGVGPYLAEGVPPVTIVRDTVPLGEVDIRRGEPVHATDGDIGRVQGLVIDRDSRHVTHVLLQEGHLWGRKEVAIPIGAVASTTDGIELTITKQDVQDLPPVDIDHPSSLT
jgi:sporulation protein YlmC with PRC-barrel domain